MSKIHLEASQVINARPADIYAVLSDYHVGHPAIVPKPYFSALTIEQGGQGAGTVIRFTVTIYGQTRHYHEVVSEPEPGRVLVETDTDSGLVTTFTVDPLNGGKQTRLTIATDFESSPGIMGLMEKLTTPPVMRRIYRQELKLIAEYVAGKANPTP